MSVQWRARVWVAAIVPYLDVQGNRFSKLRSVIKLSLYYTDLPWIVTKYRPNCSVFVFQITGLVSQWTERRGRGCTAPRHLVEVSDSDILDWEFSWAFTVLPGMCVENLYRTLNILSVSLFLTTGRVDEKSYLHSKAIRLVWSIFVVSL